MAKDESFLLMSLSDSKAKKVAQVVNNDSCRKILDYLSKRRSATETEVSKDLNIPLPTAHYNLKMLVEVSLVNIDEYHYSKKGKEVNHYSLANKYIIIAPREESSTIFDKLKKILPAFGVIVLGSAIIKAVEWFKERTIESQDLMMAKAAPTLMMAESTIQDNATQFSWTPGVATWFFLGGISALLIYTIVDWIKDKK